MLAESAIEFYLYATAAVIAIKLLINGRRDLVSFFLLFYFFFALGPVINLVIGNKIYFGTPLEYVHVAVKTFFLAITTMCVTSVVIKTPKETINNASTNNNILNAVFSIFIIFSIFQISYISLTALSLDKVLKIQKVGAKFHYTYLLLQLFLTSYFYFCRKNLSKKLYNANFISYMIYCVLLGERDFIFPLTSILGHILLYESLTKKAKALIVTFISSLTLVGTLIFVLRDANQKVTNIWESILNQGSLLFVNSYTAKLINEKYDFFMGKTYLNSLANLLPSWIYTSEYNNLAWLKNNYAPGGESGYGFGLDAEGYMNFGHLGVVLTFLVIIVMQRLIIRNINKHDFLKYYSIFFHGFTMYCFRNDSLAFIKGNVYALIIYYLIFISDRFVKKYGSPHE